jgi:hypothetical protein
MCCRKMQKHYFTVERQGLLSLEACTEYCRASNSEPPIAVAGGVDLLPRGARALRSPLQLSPLQWEWLEWALDLSAVGRY